MFLFLLDTLQWVPYIFAAGVIGACWWGNYEPSKKTWAMTTSGQKIFVGG